MKYLSKGGLVLERKKRIGLIFILFLFASWLAGSMMNFQFEAGEGGGWDISFIGPFITIILFAIPVAIFWRARTKIFFIIFSAGLFFIITPVFFQALTVLILGITVSGVTLIFIAFKKGYLSKKKAGALIGVTSAFGGSIFYWLISTPSNTRGGMTSGDESSFALWEDILPGLGHLEGPGLFMLILISLFAVGFFFYQKYDLYELFMKEEEDEKEIESDVSSAVDKAIRDLLEGKDIRATIMECYNQMSLILEEKGIRDEKHMTPREFEKAADENLDVTTSKISRIRKIFEQAKYSSHKLKEKDKETVIEDLEALRDELG
ncbi:MAG: DUF4129 domain-containing protein [Candidatus Natronoplasma sp.]